jgi:hypothetical protein
MTHSIYSQQALAGLKLTRLKKIAAELGVTPTGDKRAAGRWWFKRVSSLILKSLYQPTLVQNNLYFSLHN